MYEHLYKEQEVARKIKWEVLNLRLASPTWRE